MTRTNIKVADHSPIELFNEARKISQQKRAEREKAKRFTLRGGDAGCITPYGEFIGAPPHRALARFMGFEVGKTIQSYNIFDNGFGNEAMWDEHMQHHPDWKVLQDEEYPVNEQKMFKYPLTGRPDGVYLDADGKALFGVEHKSICSGSTAKTIFDKYEPKTDNLIQAAAYSMFLNLPWVLVYTSNSNYNFSKNKADKFEFPMEWRDGTVWFYRGQNAIETIITDQGIKDFYSAICEAYDTKDHSFFKRAAIDYKGDPYNNWDEYEEFNLMVDPSWEWSKWVEYAEKASQSENIIRYGKVNKQPRYSIYNLTEEKVLRSFATLEEAREDVYENIS